jgi:acyl-CoA reductase-like NAD-dependent aldehyde dehydrogenase
MATTPLGYDTAPADPIGFVRDLALTQIIAGEPAPATHRGTLIDPCSGAASLDYPDADPADADRAVAAARAAFPRWAATPWEERRAALNRFADAMEAALDTLAIIVAVESGRPLWRARAEITYSLFYVRRIAAAELPPVELPREGLRVAMIRRPLGVVGAIAPWNGPVILAIAKVANALLAGDTMVLRPSPFTPLSALYLGRLGAGIFPPGVLNVITGDAEVGAALVAHPDVAKISFTGSTATGKRIMAAAADTLKRVTLELGGNDAAIILPDADLAAVAATLFQISLGNAGHFCAAVKRVYIHVAVYAPLRDALVAQAEAAVLGPAFDPRVTMGPVQNRPQFDRIWSLFDDAVTNGARVLTGGQRHAGPGLFIPPTLVEGIGHGTALVDEEQFGPVLPLLRFSDLDEAIALANTGPYGLGGSVWTADLDRGWAVAQRLDVGTAWINQHGAFSAAIPMPFAKQSGIGIDYAEYGVAEHMQTTVLNARL